MILALDTATARGSLALVEEGQVLGEFSLETPGTYLQHLLPGVEAMLAGAARQLAEVKGLVVSQGPGNFTGLRIGLATAKALAFALGVPLVAVSTLTVLAAAFPFQSGSVGVLVDAKRREVYLGLYSCPAVEPQALGEARRLAVIELPGVLVPPLLLTGPGLSVHEEYLRAELSPAIKFAPPELRPPRAATLARLGSALLARGEIPILESLAPAYLRPAL